MLKESVNSGTDRQRFVTAPIFHITDESLLLLAQAKGEYRHSSLSIEGFIHCSKLEQILPVTKKYFRGEIRLVLLEITVAKLQNDLRYEKTTGGTELFPHVYGPINIDAISAVYQLEASSDGIFTLPRPLQIGPE